MPSQSSTTIEVEFEQEFLDAINDRLRPLIARLAAATLPICQPGRRGLLTPAGSGVLLRIGDRRYVLTASHVFENADPDQPIAAIVGKEFVALRPDLRWRTRSGHQETPDRADLAVVSVEASTGDDWLGTRSISLAEIDPFDLRTEHAPTTSFLALGYPRSKQPKALRDGQYSAFAYHFLTHREALSANNSIGATSDQHIVVGYDRTDFFGSPGLEEMPLPEGMSGGGLWRIPFATSALQPEARLVAILIEHHQRQKVILASRIASMLCFLRTLTSDNAVAVDELFPGLDMRAT